MFQDSIPAIQEFSGKEIYNDVMGRLDALALQLKLPAEYLWEMLTQKHFWVNGVIGCAFALLFISIGLFCLQKLHALFVANEVEDEHYWYLAPIILGLLTGIIVAGCSAPQLIMPEYYAFREIMEAVF